MGARIRLALGCAALAAAVVPTPTASGADTACTSMLGGDWADQGSTCVAAVASPRQATMTISVQLPGATANPVAGQAISSYLRPLVDRWRSTGASMVRDSDYHVDSQEFTHNTLTSVVFHEFWQTFGSPPNDAYRTFTFDLARGRQLKLADLFKPGVDPLTALPPLVRPYLVPALDQATPPHDPGTYPFTTDKFEPQPDGSGYSGNYRAFALTGDELILYLPDAPMDHERPFPRDRFVWSMDGGAVTVHVPLASLSPILAV
jgi:hypothetical protein